MITSIITVITTIIITTIIMTTITSTNIRGDAADVPHERQRQDGARGRYVVLTYHM